MEVNISHFSNVAGGIQSCTLIRSGLFAISENKIFSEKVGLIITDMHPACIKIALNAGNF